MEKIKKKFSLEKNINSKFLINRELSFLKFNNRVLLQTLSDRHPLLEKANFLSITQTNLDEWFTTRLAKALHIYKMSLDKTKPHKVSPKAKLNIISNKAGSQLKKLHRLYDQSLFPLLIKNKINIISLSSISTSLYKWLKNYFQKNIFPNLTFFKDDGLRPVPFLPSNSLNLGIRLQKKRTIKQKNYYIFIQIPQNLPRLIKLPFSNKNNFILIENVIRKFVKPLFNSYQIKEINAFTILRDMELSIAEDKNSNLLKKVRKQLKKREHGQVIRVITEEKASKKMEKHFLKIFPYSKNRIYRVPQPVDLSFLNKLTKLIKKPNYSYKPFKPKAKEDLLNQNIFQEISKKDVILQHPYDSFSPIINLIKRGAEDPNVISIKISLYRISSNSLIANSLIKAAQAGKKVTALLELKARFDEKNNVAWSEKLKQQGVNVIYGFPNLKTHLKMLLIKRRENNKTKGYAHIGTGNYNEKTAHLYTDLSLLTANQKITEDIDQIFNFLAGQSDFKKLRLVYASPNGIAKKINNLIDNEKKNANLKRKCGIWLKANSLNDEKTAKKLVEAGQNGVPVHLLIRGIEILKPEIKGYTNNIQVHSIVGRFLEHSRIYAFKNNGDTLIFISSSDLMPRNLYRRIELMVPIIQKQTKDKVIQIIKTMWSDNVNTWIMNLNGNYNPYFKKKNKVIDCHQIFLKK